MTLSIDYKLMENTFKIVIILLSFFVFDAEASDMTQQDMVSGKVVMNSNKQGVGNVTIEIDDQKEVLSNSSGDFEYSVADISSRPKNVVAYAEGLEIANWEYENKKLTVYMRNATVKTVRGILTSNGKAVVNQIVILKGSVNFESVTDAKGQFIYKIPYNDTIDINSKFMTNEMPLRIESIIEHPRKSLVSLKLNLTEYQPEISIT